MAPPAPIRTVRMPRSCRWGASADNPSAVLREAPAGMASSRIAAPLIRGAAIRDPCRRRAGHLSRHARPAGTGRGGRADHCVPETPLTRARDKQPCDGSDGWCARPSREPCRVSSCASMLHHIPGAGASPPAGALRAARALRGPRQSRKPRWCWSGHDRPAGPKCQTHALSSNRHRRRLDIQANLGSNR